MDLYERLGVRRGAGAAEIRRAWQRLVARPPPGPEPGRPRRRRALPRGGPGLRGALRPAAPRRLRPRRAARRRRWRRPPEGGFEGFDFSARVRIETVGFREIFDRPRRPAGGGAARGEDLEQATRVSFEESMPGAERRVHLVRFEPCAACGGAGEVAFGPVPCPRCQGSGTVRGSRGHMIFSRPCGDCGGAGRDPAQALRPLRRRGAGDRERVARGPHPAGGRQRQPGAPARGAGNAGRRGGPPGDFVLTVEVEAHPVFRREGDDLHCVVRGGHGRGGDGRARRGPDPRRTGDDRGAGRDPERPALPPAQARRAPTRAAGGAGDLWVEARVVIPAVTDDRARALLRELAAVLPRS